jgi:hypothetical protein
VRTGLSRLKYLWLDAGYEGRDKRWAEEVLGLRGEVVRKPAKPMPEKVARIWAEEWAKEDEKIAGSLVRDHMRVNAFDSRCR